MSTTRRNLIEIQAVESIIFNRTELDNRKSGQLAVEVLKALRQLPADVVEDILPESDREIRLVREDVVISIWLPANASEVASAMLALAETGFDFVRNDGKEKA